MRRKVNTETQLVIDELQRIGYLLGDIETAARGGRLPCAITPGMSWARRCRLILGPSIGVPWQKTSTDAASTL